MTRKHLLLTGVALVITGLVLCALHLTGPRRASVSFLGVEWFRHTYFGLGTVLCGAGAFIVVVARLIRSGPWHRP